MRNAIFVAIAMAAAVLTVLHMQGERSLATGVTRRAAFRGFRRMHMNTLIKLHFGYDIFPLTNHADL